MIDGFGDGQETEHLVNSKKIRLERHPFKVPDIQPMTLFASYRKVISVLVFAFLPVLAGAFPQETPPAGQTSTQPVPKGDKSIATNPTTTSAGAPVDSSKYKIGPGDVLLIRVWNEPAFTGPVAVHEDGKITLQLVGDLDAGGKTPLDVQDVIADSLKKYVVKPLVTVTVESVGSKRYYMDGLIARTGEYALVVPTTILEAISKAGGLQDFANQKRIYVLRGQKRIYFNYKDVIRGKHMDQNILLESNDHIVVP